MVRSGAPGTLAMLVGGACFVAALACTGGGADEEAGGDLDEVEQPEGREARGKGARGGKRGGKSKGVRGSRPREGGGGKLRLAYNNGTALDRDDAGEMHAVWVDNGKVVYTRYAPDGKESKKTMATDATNFAVVDTDGDTGVVISWTSREGLFAVVSTNDGATFSSPSKLTDEVVPAPTVRVWKTGGVMKKKTAATIAWHEGEAKVSGHIYESTWTEGNWSTKRQVDDTDAAAEYASLGGSGDHQFMFYRDNRGGSGFDVYFRDRTELGGSWGPERKVARGFDPSVCVTDNGWVHVGYQHEVVAYYVRSTDKGQTWSEPTELGPGLFSRVVCNEDGKVAIAWEWIDESRKSGHGKAAQSDEAKTFGLAMSTDHGNHFDVTKPVDGWYVKFATATLDAKGKLDLMYVDGRTNVVKIKTVPFAEEKK